MSEIWKDIKGFEGSYQVSNLGRVKSMERKIPHNVHSGFRTIRERILKNQDNSNGYKFVVFGYKGKINYIHRLVAKEFIINTENKHEVNHINGLKDDNRVENLEWCTHSENQKHALKTGLFKNVIGVNNHKSKLTEKEVLEIRKKYSPLKYTQKMLGKEYGVSRFVIRDIVNRITWKHI